MIQDPIKKGMEIDKSTVSTRKTRYSYEHPERNSHYRTQDLLDSPIYNDVLMDNIMVGIAQNIWTEMEKQEMTMRGLSTTAMVSYSQLSKVFNNKARLGLETVIKLASALHVSPGELFPYDTNKRKTNGQIFDEITKGLDLESVNYLLEVVIGYTNMMNKAKQNK